MDNKEIKQIKIVLNNGTELAFNGKYRRDLEQPNWHYYEDVSGGIYHCRKDTMVYVFETDIGVH